MSTSSNNNGWTWSKRLNRSVTSVCPCIGHDPCAPEYVSEDGRRLYGSCSSGSSSAPSVNWNALDAHDIDPRSNQHPDNGPYMSTPPMDIKGKGARHRDDDDYYQGSFLDTRGSTGGDSSLGRSEDRLLPHTARDRREYGTIGRHDQYSNTPGGTVAGPSNTRQGDTSDSSVFLTASEGSWQSVGGGGGGGGGQGGASQAGSDQSSWYLGGSGSSQNESFSYHSTGSYGSGGYGG